MDWEGWLLMMQPIHLVGAFNKYMYNTRSRSDYLDLSLNRRMLHTSTTLTHTLAPGAHSVEGNGLALVATPVAADDSWTGLKPIIISERFGMGRRQNLIWYGSRPNRPTTCNEFRYKHQATIRLQRTLLYATVGLNLPNLVRGSSEGTFPEPPCAISPLSCHNPAHYALPKG